MSSVGVVSQDRLAPKLQQGPPLSRRGGEQSAQQPVSSRLGVQSGAARRADALQATVRRPMNSAEHQVRMIMPVHADSP